MKKCENKEIGKLEKPELENKKNNEMATPYIKNCLFLACLKLLLVLLASEFPSEIPRTQNRNFPYA